jgi:UDP-N-acetyl-D-glucosamine dehydrogenase
VNIALVNEMKVILQAMGIDVWEVIEAAKTKPFGFQAFYPGPGLGGHCIPIDPYYLTWKAREVGMPTRFIELAGEVNHLMPEYVVRRTGLALNDRGKAVKGSRILVLGLAYKPDVDDVRESPSFELITRLRDLGATVDYNDPHVPQTTRCDITRSYRRCGAWRCRRNRSRATTASWSPRTTRRTTGSSVADHAKLVVDTRNALVGVAGKRDHIVKA